MYISIQRKREEKEREFMKPKFNSNCSSSSHTSNLIWVLIFINLISLSLSDPRISEARLLCGTKRPPPNTTNIPTFVKEMEVLSQLVNKQKWGHHALNSSPPMYGIAQCFGDLSQTDCLLCYAASRTRIPRCLPAVSARIYLDGCFQRYDEYDFFHESTDPVHDSVNCSDSVGGFDQTSLGFNVSVGNLIDNLTDIAVLNGGFGVSESKGVFGLAQCWKTVSSDGCRVCLEEANKKVRSCLPSREGRGLIAGCYLRYSTKKFYNDGSEIVIKHSGESKRVTAAISSAASAFFLLLILAAYAGYVRLSKRKEGRHNLGKIPSLFSKSSLTYKYETLEKATDYFNPSRKIGQGGAGSVYKGTLHDGKIVAVKRLFFHTRQWVDEFFNEVNLINGIQHKNLVKLLGCSIEGPESLLVYEYVPNKSLDQFLFEKNKTQILNWNQRFDIIVGTAEGLAYLHDGCHVRIIHRDIKSSNVLLDGNLNPKIADFGLARCFAADQTHLSTGIAGTLGYMAPEYLVRGQLTEKADVYSFGVLVLEIVSGRKNNAFVEDSGSLLQTIWKLYKTDKLVESVDPCLKYDFPEKEANKVLQIGLLCSQASATLRPSMAEVVQMLNNKDAEIPMASQPPFLNASLLGPAASNGYYSIKGLVSNVLGQFEVSNTSTVSTSVNSSDQPSGSEELTQKLFQSNTR